MLRILIVDDDPNIQVLFTRMLRKAGFITYGAENGRRAEELVPNWKPDVILMDFLMPLQDGCETTRNLRTSGYTGQIIIVSALQSPANDPATCGADGFLQKPIDIDKVLQMLAITNNVQHA
jgi:two-component system, OmpR family, alkaline phosphatase synthesis response regulator PhoP